MDTTPPIVLTTDFGASDSYVGVMKGVILRINPQAHLLDLTHPIQPQNVAQAAFMLGVSWRYFPQGSIHLCVVDPGVGTDRRPLLLETPDASFVAPDNGLLSYVLRDYLAELPPGPGRVTVPPELAAYELTNSDCWLQPLSNTFHGRDLFAPVAAHRSLGVAPKDLGQRVSEVVWLPAPQPESSGREIRGQVVYIDHFGNLVTNIAAGQIPERSPVRVEIKGRQIDRLSRTFADHEPEETLIALVGSYGYLEVAVPNGNASQTLGVGVGEPVLLLL
jgi:S-adenosylmethionine hydrolase